MSRSAIRPARPLRLPALLLATIAASAATPAMAACSVTTPLADDLGSYSPAALKAGAPAPIRASGGFSCTANLLTLLGNNYLRATVPSNAVLRLTSTTTSDTIDYTLSADAAGTVPIVPGTPRTYVSGTTLNLLGLLGPSTVDVPVYLKPTATAATIPPGTYKGSVMVKWEWSFCSLINAAVVCIGTLDASTIFTPSARLDFTLTVAARPVTMTISTRTTWDPQSTTNFPKAIPGSRQRTTVTVVNPDIVPIDLNSIALVLPTAPRATVALDGDGTGQGDVVQVADGTPPSTLSLAYRSAGDTGDDVQFSSDNGTSYGYAPVAGNDVSQSAVTQVRFRPRGTMAASSSFSVSIPYLVR